MQSAKEAYATMQVFVHNLFSSTVQDRYHSLVARLATAKKETPQESTSIVFSARIRSIAARAHSCPAGTNSATPLSIILKPTHENSGTLLLSSHVAPCSRKKIGRHRNNVFLKSSMLFVIAREEYTCYSAVHRGIIYLASSLFVTSSSTQQNIAK